MIRLRFLLLQARDADDPIRESEIGCFARKLNCPEKKIRVHDLTAGGLPVEQLEQYDAVLVGGSGDYSAVTGGPWLPAALDLLREIHRLSKPTFASCWGFQAFARALGGKVVTDTERAEIGTLPLRLTDAGKDDPVFGYLGSPFLAQLGHQDIVDELPPDAECLSSTDRVTNQAFVFRGKPIYGTQFHPELDKEDLVRRLVAYPTYVQEISGMSLDDFVNTVGETPKVKTLLGRFVEHVFPDS